MEQTNNLIKLHLDGNIAFIGTNKKDNSNYLVFKSKDCKFHFTMSFKYLRANDGYATRYFDPNKKIRVYEVENKSEKWITFEEFKNLFEIKEIEHNAGK